MCYRVQADLECCEDACDVIIIYMAFIEDERCKIAIDNGLETGHCGSYEDRKLNQPMKANTNHRCKGCDDKNREERYKNAGKHVTESLESQWRRDAERRKQKEQLNASLFSLAGTGWAADQGGQDLGGSEILHLDPEMGVSAMPQELDLDDVGEGPSQGHGQGYRQGGSEGHDQRGGQGSGGWSYQ